MAKQNSKSNNDYHQYGFQICGTSVGLGVKLLEEGDVEIGISIYLTENDSLLSNEIDVQVVSDHERNYNCIMKFRDSVLPIIELSSQRIAFCGLRFQPVEQNDDPESIVVILRGERFMLNLKDERYKGESTTLLPPEFPSYIGKKNAEPTESRDDEKKKW